MRNFRFAVFVAALAASASLAAPAMAHALLDHATPGVGSTVQGSPAELALSFSETIVAGFSGASLTTAEGASVPTGKAVADPSSPATFHVSVGQKLKPGIYVVNWRAVSIDTHRTSGTFKFTVAP
jgi:methionine-rich copper-binding protein CopC